MTASPPSPAHAPALLRHAEQLLPQVLRFEQPTDRLLAQYFKANRGLGSRERARLADAVYAVLRLRTLFEMQAAGPQRLRRLALLGLHECGVLAPTDMAAPERAWLAACAAQRQAALPAACRHNLPDWLATALQDMLGDEFDAAAQALLQPAPLDLRVNLLRHKRPAVQAELAALGVRSEPTRWSPWGLRVAGKPALRGLAPMRDGAVQVQDEGSQLLALLVGARRGEMVADVCAGAGGKTLALGAAMRGTGRLYAMDVSAARLARLQERLPSSGLANVHMLVPTGAGDMRLRRLYGKMDRVLVDAPCSGLGTLRRSPDLKWRQPADAIAGFAAQQQRILQQAAQLLRPGGRLVYATCSPLAEENEAVAAAFDAALPAFSPLPVAPLLARLKVAQGERLCTADGRYLRLWPHRHGTDGFFAAAWQRS